MSETHQKIIQKHVRNISEQSKTNQNTSETNQNHFKEIKTHQTTPETNQKHFRTTSRTISETHQKTKTIQKEIINTLETCQTYFKTK